MAYHGSPERALEFFASLGYHCPESFNPPEHYIKTLAIVAGHVMACKDKVKVICDAFEHSPEAADVRSALHADTSREQEMRSVLVFEQSPRCVIKPHPIVPSFIHSSCF